MKLEDIEVEITKLRLKPDDIVVVKCPLPLTQEQTEVLQARFATAIPGHKVLVVTWGLDVGVAIHRKITSEYFRMRREYEDTLKLLAKRAGL
jgi:hypothetical protein